MTTDAKSRGLERRSKLGRMAKRQPGLVGRRTKTGLVHLTVVLDPRQVEALKAEAVRRAGGWSRPDMSAVLRQIVDAWLMKAAKR